MVQRCVFYRDIVDALSGKRRPAYTTIQTTVYRIEAKNIVRRVKKVGNLTNLNTSDAAIT